MDQRTQLASLPILKQALSTLKEYTEENVIPGLAHPKVFFNAKIPLLNERKYNSITNSLPTCLITLMQPY